VHLTHAQDVEDQPYATSSVCPSERVFHRDDCEGRAAEIQLMVELLQAMACVDSPNIFMEAIKCDSSIPLKLNDDTLIKVCALCLLMHQV
jgi:hypothetical protein